MLREVQAHALSLFIGTQADGLVYQKHDGPGDHEGPTERCADSNKLINDLLAAADAVTQSREADADEKSGGQRAPYAAYTVNAEDSQGIVNFQLQQQFDRGVAKDTCSHSNDQSGHRPDEASRRRDGHQACHGAGSR